MLKRFTRPFRQLRGKLTLSYMLTSVVTFLLMELIFIAVVLWFVNFNISSIILDDLKKEAPQAATYFIHGSADRQELTSGLNVIGTTLPNLGPPGQSHSLTSLTVVDTQGQTIASIGTHPFPSNTPIYAQLSPQSRANLHMVLNDEKGTTSQVYEEADGTLLAIAPIVGQAGNLQGALVMKTVKPDIFQLISDFLYLILVTGSIVTIIAAISGSIFGYLSARGLTRRLKRLSVAAEMWGRGNFSALTHDASVDELGQTSRQLNRMAEQLQNLLQARQKLATLEERNRLARDLHDSVKQQVFAISMQIGATKVLLKRDGNAAEARLNEAEKLVRQAQQELTSLIRELRPVALEGKGLVVALHELATDWTNQTNIVATLRVEGVDGTAGTQTLPLTIEEALFRVAQEALSNVARHSNATLVQMILTVGDDSVTLSVADNGKGFDTAHQGRLGVGLLSMQERMKALGGNIEIESTPGKGARIVAHCKRSSAGTSDVLAIADDKDANSIVSDTFKSAERI
ncbi:MAG TPA: histidine kinase [Ktedonobacteraceae bacterium]